MARLIEGRGLLVLGAAAAIVVLGLAGASTVSVENRFIDNFDESTEIYQGMYLIDRVLGGTTPLDIVIDAPAESEDDDGFEEDWDDEFGIEGDAGITATSYWFNNFRLDDVAAIHAYNDGLDETGKVLSLSTTMDVLTQLNGGAPPSDFFLSQFFLFVFLTSQSFYLFSGFAFLTL